MIDETDTGAEQPKNEKPKAEKGSSLAPARAARIADGPVDYADLRGDAMRAMYEFAEGHMKPTVSAIHDPLSGAAALVKIDGHGNITKIDPTIFDGYMVGPRLRSGNATLLSLDSYIEHTNRFSDEDSVIFADNNRTKPTLTTVHDYHMADSKDGGRTVERGTPRYGRHRSLFAFPLSDEWQAWNAKNKTFLSMKEFAHFLEDHAIDVLTREEIELSPAAEKYVERIGGHSRIADPSALVSLAHSFEVYEQSNAGRSENLNSGEQRATLETIHVDAQGRPLEIPTMFVLGIPVFKMGELYQIIARLRYRKVNGDIVFAFELWRTDLIFDTAFNEAVEKVGDETGLPVLLGAPEAVA